MANLIMRSSTRSKLHLLSIGLVGLAAVLTIAAYLLHVMSLPIALLSLAAQLSSVAIQLLGKPSDSSGNNEPVELPLELPPAASGPTTVAKAEFQIADFLNANLLVLNGDLRTPVPFPKGVRADDKELVKSFVKRLRSVARELQINNTVSADAPSDPVINHSGTAPSSVVGLARELETQIQKGNAAIRHGHESVRELRELLVESSSRLRRIRDHSRSVRDGVELVKDLSDQTNVLALNAAIQASRSGEDGLGVVAEELQRVAVRGADSGRKLEEQIEALRDDLSDAMAAITRGEQGAATTLKSHEAVQDAYSLVEQTSSEIAAKAKSANS